MKLFYPMAGGAAAASVAYMIGNAAGNSKPFEDKEEQTRMIVSYAVTAAVIALGIYLTTMYISRRGMSQQAVIAGMLVGGVAPVFKAGTIKAIEKVKEYTPSPLAGVAGLVTMDRPYAG